MCQIEVLHRFHISTMRTCRGMQYRLPHQNPFRIPGAVCFTVTGIGSEAKRRNI